MLKVVKKISSDERCKIDINSFLVVTIYKDPLRNVQPLFPFHISSMRIRVFKNQSIAFIPVLRGR